MPLGMARRTRGRCATAPWQRSAGASPVRGEEVLGCPGAWVLGCWAGGRRPQPSGLGLGRTSRTGIGPTAGQLASAEAAALSAGAAAKNSPAATSSLARMTACAGVCRTSAAPTPARRPASRAATARGSWRARRATEMGLLGARPRAVACMYCGRSARSRSPAVVPGRAKSSRECSSRRVRAPSWRSFARALGVPVLD